MAITSSDFFGSGTGLATVSKFYSGLSQEQMDRHMALVQDAVRLLTANTQNTGRKLRILDAGCGDGNQSPVLSTRFNALVTGVTPFDGEYKECLDKAAAGAAERRNPYQHVTFLKAGMPALEGLDRGFDVIYSDCSFQYMKGDDRTATLARFAALAPKGVIALRYPDRPTFSPDSCHPSADEFRAEISAFNRASGSPKLTIASLNITPDTLAEKRPEKNIRMIEALLVPA
jgi:trans-aconitate methyltransferase